MKKLFGLFVVVTLVMGVMIGCALPFNENGDDSDTTGVPDTYLQFDDSGLYYFETVDSNYSVYFKFSIPVGAALRYLASDSNSGMEFENDRTSFSSVVKNNSSDSRQTKTSASINKKYILVAYDKSYDGSFDWENATTGAIQLTHWTLRSGYTQAQTPSGTLIPLGYRVYTSGEVTKFIADYFTGGALLYELNSQSRDIQSTDTTVVSYTAGENGVDVGKSLFINLAYWTPENNSGNVATLNWSLCQKFSVQFTYNASGVPFFQVNGVSQTTGNLAEGAIVKVVAPVTTATVYYVATTGTSQVIDPTKLTLSTVQNGVGSIDVPVHYNGSTLFTIQAFCQEVGKGLSSVAMFTTSPSSTPSTVAVTSISLPGSLTVNTGGSGTLSATINPSNATNKNVTWSSSNTAVATVSQTGEVTGVSAGSATITATAQDVTNGSHSAYCYVTVTGNTVSAVNLNVGSTYAGRTLKIYFGSEGWSTSHDVVVLSNGRVPLSIPVGAEFSVTMYYNNEWMDLSGVGVKDYIASGWIYGPSLTASVRDKDNIEVRTMPISIGAAQ